MGRVTGRLSIRLKLAAIALVALLGLMGVAGTSLLFLYEALLADRQTEIRQSVQVAHALVEHFHDQVVQGDLTLEQGQQSALMALKKLRYGDDNYFWINDMRHFMVMHPLKPELDGKEMSQVQDPAGKRLFVAFVERVQQSGEGFVEYLWPKPGESKPLPKLSFVKGFQPWGWVIGSGIYIDDVNATAWQQGKTFSATVLGILLLLLGVVWSIARKITRPIDELSHVMKQVAQDGNLDHRVSVGQADEVGQMAASFNALLGKLQGFTVRVQDEVTRLAQSGDKLSGAGVQVLHQMNTLHDETMQAATAMNEMSASAEEVSRNVTAAAEHSESADRQARTGHETVGRNLAATEKLASGVREAGENVRELTKEAESIGSIIDVINGIAEQTNLLALNAAIEAARAGDQGRGFAVVADEVRTLAQRTQQSTSDIRQMIERLHAGVRCTTDVMENCLRQTDASVQGASEAQQALEAITGSSSVISGLNNQIASAALEQSNVTEDINRNITNINTAAGETARLAKDASVETAQFGAVLSEVIGTLGQFHSDTDWHYQLAAAKTAHLLWKIRVRGFLDGHIALSTEEAVSHHECRFGRWYDGLAKRGFQIPPSLTKAEQPHESLHSLVRQIIQLSQEGRKSEAEKLYSRLDQVSANILGLLDKAGSEAGAAA